MTRQTDFLPTVQALVQCYQAFEAYSAAHVRELGLTPPQFDIIATLGNTVGMTATELGEKTLITKGTLTGVVDRLSARSWVERVAHESDGRCQIIRLTQAGEALFEKVFPAHLAHMNTCFAGATAAEHTDWQTTLRSLEQVLRKGAA